VRTAWRHRVGFIERVRASDEMRLLACWLLLPLIVFTLARSRLPLYLLPLFVPLALIAARALVPLDMSRTGTQLMIGAWCIGLVILRAVPAWLDIAEDDRALARGLVKELPVAPNEIAFVEAEPRYGLRFYLDSEIERLELPGDETKLPAQDIRSEMREREGCRLLLANEWNLPRLEKFLAGDAIVHKRIADVRGYAAIAQVTPDCPAYGTP
jgi:4-amino-4-deoxy-L-arabinose transferase